MLLTEVHTSDSKRTGILLQVFATHEWLTSIGFDKGFTFTPVVFKEFESTNPIRIVIIIPYHF